MLKYFKPNEVLGLSQELKEKLDKAREFAGVPFFITSGLRTIERNKEVGGVDDSAHIRGLAVDLLCQNSYYRFQIISGLLVAGFKRIGIYDTHIHTDIDPSKPQDIIYLS